jgi:glycosyltransferase involved in cell wall biosynthesis
MGLATGLDVVLDAAARLAGDPRFRFVLVGAGADAERLARRIADDGLHNVRMLGVLPRPVALRVVADADVCLVPLRSAITDSLPTKLFDAMFVSRPAIVSAGGEARRVLEESGGGIAVPPGDGAALAGALRTLAADPALCARLGASGNAYVNEHYDRARIMRELAAAIEVAAAAQPAPLRAST